MRFARKEERRGLIPKLREQYVKKLMENPLTEFDFIGHSNGTYALAQALRTTPSMQFRNVVLAAPVLPTDFDWDLLFNRDQLKKIRYDVALDDLPVGLLCQLLWALGQSDVGPAGVVGFGEGRAIDSRLQQVGWYEGGHGAALLFDKEKGIDNRGHLLNFARDGDDKKADTRLLQIGWLGWVSRLVPYTVWIVLGSIVWGIVFLFYRGRWRTLRVIGVTMISAVVVTVIALNVV